jgi:peptidoglycan L-alanyl-D-glutamate endopeptidase CwlK
MPVFGEESKRKLATCDPRLIALFNEVIKHWDCRVTCGYRNKEDQDLAYKRRNSTKKWPNSKHNIEPSIAVDVVPYPVNWGDINRFYMFSGFVLGVASQMGIKIRTGADWDGDGDIQDQLLIDLPHFELTE